MKETDCGFLSAVEACSWDLCLWRAWKLWHLAAAALTFPAQLSLCQWGAAAVKAERPWCLQDMKSALWTVTIVWGGQTLFTAVLWQFILSFCLFHTAVVNLDNSVVDLKTFQDLYKNVSNRRFSVWKSDTHTVLVNVHIWAHCLHVVWGSLIREHWTYISLDLLKFILCRNVLNKCMVS